MSETKIGFAEMQKGEPMSKTLNEDDVLKEIDRWIDYLDEDMITRIKIGIKKLPSAQPEQRWIPVSEGLPEKEGWYITTVESEKTGKRRIEIDLFAIDIALAHGNTPNKFCKDGYRQRTVAWCEFPEPYKGEGEAE